jgi:hypothetical protein
MTASEGHFEMLREKLLKFMDEHIYPNEQLFFQQSEEIRLSSNGFWTHPPIVVELKAQQNSLIVLLGLGLVSCFGLDLQAICLRIHSHVSCLGLGLGQLLNIFFSTFS